VNQVNELIIILINCHSMNNTKVQTTTRLVNSFAYGMKKNLCKLYLLILEILILCSEINLYF
ncbi:MAG TPA: hypothetical protein VIL14_04345, partial [Nitrososphaeraceae archaeon]